MNTSEPKALKSARHKAAVKRFVKTNKRQVAGFLQRIGQYDPNSYKLETNDNKIYKVSKYLQRPTDAALVRQARRLAVDIKRGGGKVIQQGVDVARHGQSLGGVQWYYVRFGFTNPATLQGYRTTKLSRDGG